LICGSLHGSQRQGRRIKTEKPMRPEWWVWSRCDQISARRDGSQREPFHLFDASALLAAQRSLARRSRLRQI
jgi:hypothetical protein